MKSFTVKELLLKKETCAFPTVLQQEFNAFNSVKQSLLEFNIH